MRPCTLFTGHSGIDSGKALLRLATYCERQDRIVGQPIKLEASMIREHLGSFPDDPDRVLLEKSGGLQYLLLQPKGYLRKLWRNAVRTTISEIPEDNEHIFLNTHAVFYNTSSRDLFSCADMRYLKELLKKRDIEVKQCITFVDDIYDCWRRLKEDHQLFCSTSDVVQSTLDLFLLLYWRSVEIFASENFAEELGIPHFVFPVKHPISVAYDLIFSNKSRIYIAHPITDIRSLENRGNSVEADRAKNEVQDLTSHLLASEMIVPFFPTTIDELILTEDPPGSGEYLPYLMQRWPFPRPDETLYVEPHHSIPEPFALPGVDADDSRAMRLLLKGLVEVIISQVDSRDRKLVEQAHGLVAWRPCFQGNVSGGVSNEISHRNSLVNFRLANRADKKAFVLIRPRDLILYRLNQALEYIRERHGSLPSPIYPDQLMQSIELNYIEKLGAEVGLLEGTELQQFLDPEESISFPRSIKSKSVLGGQRGTIERAERSHIWLEITEEINNCLPEEFAFQDSDDVLYGSQLTTREFVRKIEEFVQE